MWERIKDKSRIDLHRTHLTAYLGQNIYLVPVEDIPDCLNVFINMIDKCLVGNSPIRAEENEIDEILELIKDWSTANKIKIEFIKS